MDGGGSMWDGIVQVNGYRVKDEIRESGEKVEMRLLIYIVKSYTKVP